MNARPPPHPTDRPEFSRHPFRKVAAGTGLTAVLGESLLITAPRLGYDKQTQRASGILARAALAPSGHKTPPWKFAIWGTTIQIAGYAAEVGYPAQDADFLTLHLSRSSRQSSTALFDALPHRQNAPSLRRPPAAVLV